MKRMLVSALTTLGLVGGSVVAMATPSVAAGCQPDRDDLKPLYKVSKVQNAKLATNLYSDYITGPGSIGYHKSKTAVVTAQASVEVTAEAGAVFAAASTSIGVSVGKSWSKTQEWSYTLQVPSGKTARMRMYHTAKSFTVDKYIWSVRTCSKSIKKWSHRVVAPVKSDSNIWALEYRK
jgi:hypothetical protein